MQPSQPIQDKLRATEIPLAPPQSPRVQDPGSLRHISTGKHKLNAARLAVFHQRAWNFVDASLSSVPSVRKLTEVHPTTLTVGDLRGNVRAPVAPIQPAPTSSLRRPAASPISPTQGGGTMALIDLAPRDAVRELKPIVAQLEDRALAARLGTRVARTTTLVAVKPPSPPHGDRPSAVPTLRRSTFRRGISGVGDVASATSPDSMGSSSMQSRSRGGKSGGSSPPLRLSNSVAVTMTEDYNKVMEAYTASFYDELHQAVPFGHGEFPSDVESPAVLAALQGQYAKEHPVELIGVCNDLPDALTATTTQVAHPITGKMIPTVVEHGNIVAGPQADTHVKDKALRDLDYVTIKQDGHLLIDDSQTKRMTREQRLAVLMEHQRNAERVLGLTSAHQLLAATAARHGPDVPSDVAKP